MVCSVFFFSSRRRHTRLQGDWSSDVCSSDLSMGGMTSSRSRCTSSVVASSCGPPTGVTSQRTAVGAVGSEERRGGEGRGWGGGRETGGWEGRGGGGRERERNRR